ncbi:MAG: hypothetical protein J4400_04385 [Candidatus Aenigmarchaeota archaeon]|nr:hypothetical protein [Candidatus Aenigmarchaeota archaeon]
MVWYLPGTWTEDLGAAKRISPYRVEYLGPDFYHKGVHHYAANCDMLVNGNFTDEMMRLTGRAPGFLFSHVPLGTRFRLIASLRKQIKNRYPVRQ